MTGAELAKARLGLGYDQTTFMKELGVKSRQTLSSWEKSESIPRAVELAVHALTIDPACRTQILREQRTRQEWRALQKSILRAGSDAQ